MFDTKRVGVGHMQYTIYREREGGYDAMFRMKRVLTIEGAKVYIDR